ncbi:MAG: TrkH family potassium uptake protein [bacterium]
MNQSVSMKSILKHIGSIQCLVAGLLLTVLPISMIYAEYYQGFFMLVSSGVVFSIGYPLHRFIDQEGEMSRGETILTAGLAWLLTALLGSLPFLLSAYYTPPEIIFSYVPAGANYSSSLLNFRNPLHAFFESMSGWTTTGLTMSVHEPTLPHTLLWYRSFMQWAGGIGVIVLALVVFPQPGTSTPSFLYESEARERKVRPSVVSTVKVISWTYIGLTLGSMIWLFVGTLLLLPSYPWTKALWDAFNHAMTAISTGGFSVLDNSTAEYGSRAMEWLTIPPMVLGGIALPVHYLVFVKGKFKTMFTDIQNRVYFLLSVIGTSIMVLLLVREVDLPKAVHVGTFQFLSALSTTGFQTGTIGDWTFVSVLFLSGTAMIIGGSAGATVGGVKIIRAYLVLRGFLWKIKENLVPDQAVVHFQVGDEQYERDAGIRMFYDALSFCAVYALILLMTTIVLLLLAPAGMGPEDVLFDAISAQGTVGLSSGFTGPGMHPGAELCLIVQMWIGRLEIIPVMMIGYFLIGGSPRSTNP